MLFGAEALREKMLLKERWRLHHVDNVPKSDLKITRGQLFVKGELRIVECDDDKQRSNIGHGHSHISERLITNTENDSYSS